jgi:hypothetical protein
MNYVEPWYAATDAALVDELRRELSKGHVLFGASLAARARRQDRNDVLFEVLDGSGRLAQVHLTYQREADPRWPSTTVFASEAAWEQSMLADHQDFCD